MSAITGDVQVKQKLNGTVSGSGVGGSLAAAQSMGAAVYPRGNDGIRGTSFFYYGGEIAESTVVLASDIVTPEGYKPMVGDMVVAANGDVCTVLSVATTAEGVKVLLEATGINLRGPEAEIETNETLSYEGGVLRVNTTNNAEADNTLPMTSAGVHVQLGNIDVLLNTI